MKNFLIALIVSVFSVGGFAQQFTLEIRNENLDSKFISRIEDSAICNFVENTYTLFDSTVYKRRKPELALLFSLLIPGGGQFYNGQNKKGIILIASTGIGALLILTSFGETNAPGFAELTVQNGTTFIMGVGLVYGSWFYSWINAVKVANRMNRLNRLSTEIRPSFQKISNFLSNKNEISFGPKITFTF